VDGFYPATGGVYPGQRIDIIGRNLDCATLFNCVWRDALSLAHIMTTSATVINEYGIWCEVPLALESSLYHPTAYGDTPGSILPGDVCPRVPPLDRVRLDVVNASLPVPVAPVDASRSTEFTLMRCKPPSSSSASPLSSVVPGSSATQASMFDFLAAPASGDPAASPGPFIQPRGEMCENDGICTTGGTCVCAPGFCGARCDVIADETAGNPSGQPISQASSQFSVYGSDISCQALHPALAVFNGIVEGDWSGPVGSDTEGLLMAARDVNIGRYSVGFEWHTPPHPLWLKQDINNNPLSRRTDIATGRDIVFTTGHNYGGGNIVWGRNGSVGINATAAAPGTKFRAPAGHPFPGADFDGAVIAMRWLSAALTRLPRTGTAIHKYARVMTLTGTRTDVNIFHLSASELAEVDEIELVLTNLPRNLTAATRPKGAALPSVVINIMYDLAWTSHGPGQGDWLGPSYNASLPRAYTVTFADLGLTGDFYYDPTIASRIVWNMPYATNLYVHRIEVVGTILAPFANVDFPAGQVDGQLLAQHMAGNGQVNLPLWTSACDPALTSLIQATTSGTFTPSQALTYVVNGTCGNGGGNCGAPSSGSGGVRRRRMLAEANSGAAVVNPFGELDPQSTTFVDPLATWRRNGVPVETLRLMEALLLEPKDALGWFGAPVLPDCGPRGFHTPEGTCECWAKDTYKGRECEIQCRDDYCNGRGMCNPNDQSKCVCFDPDRWVGDRCETSVCGDNAILITPATSTTPAECVCAPGFGRDTNGRCLEELPCANGYMIGDKCQCLSGWSGTDCRTPFPEPISCFHGTIVTSTIDVVAQTGPTAGQSRPVTIHNCSCFEGWIGSACDVWAGRGSDYCYFGVYDSTAGYCKCDPLWAGPKCDVYTCLHGVAETVRVSSDGQSTGPNSEVIPTTVIDSNGGIVTTSANSGPDTVQCRCLDGWTGADCGTHCRGSCNWRGTICSADVITTGSVSSTSGSASTECICDAGFSGSQCETAPWETPAAVASAPDSQVVSASTTVSYTASSSGSQQQAAARLLATMNVLAGRSSTLRGNSEESSLLEAAGLGRKLQTASAGVFELSVSQTAGMWRASRLQTVSGSSSQAAQACALSGPAAVVGGGASHNGAADELVSCIPVLVRIRRTASRAAGQVTATTISIRIPESMRSQLVGTHTYAAIASSTSSSAGAVNVGGCVAGAPAGSTASSGSGGADAQYNWATGTVTAVVCEAGLYHVQFMQPSVVNRALPPPGQDAGPIVFIPEPLQGWAIALIVIGAVIFVIIIAAVTMLVRRNNRSTVTPSGVHPTGPILRPRASDEEHLNYQYQPTSEDRSPVPVDGVRLGRPLSASGSVDDALAGASTAINERRARRKAAKAGRHHSVEGTIRKHVGPRSSEASRPESAEETVDALFRD
jgi:choice-of-anchor A domain-containing protein